jgi:hypothetical protein
MYDPDLGFFGGYCGGNAKQVLSITFRGKSIGINKN